MTQLAEKHCVPCEGGVVPLPAAEVARLLKALPGWETRDDATWLYKEYRFRNWKQAMAMANRISDIAEQEKHHPDLEVGWGYCRVRLQTHAIGGLHENDFIVATKIEALQEP